jgi:hypothetical protein
MERQRKQILVSEDERKQKEDESAAHCQLLLQPVIAAINAEQFNHGRDNNDRLLLSEATLQAIETFRAELKRWLLNNGNGFHLCNNTLQEVYNTYAELAEEWVYEYNKRALFEDGVLSSILTFVPANDAQKFSQGLNYLYEKQEPCRRSLALREGVNDFYAVLRGPSLNFALSGACIDILFGELLDRYRYARAPDAMQNAISKLISNKNYSFSDLMNPSETPIQTQRI